MIKRLGILYSILLFVCIIGKAFFNYTDIPWLWYIFFFIAPQLFVFLIGLIYIIVERILFWINDRKKANSNDK